VQEELPAPLIFPDHRDNPVNPEYPRTGVAHGVTGDLHADPAAPVRRINDIEPAEREPIVVINNCGSTYDPAAGFGAEEPPRIHRPEARGIMEAGVPPLRCCPRHGNRNLLFGHRPELYGSHNAHPQAFGIGRADTYT
jgi:hypothetical protein